jgi:hypothetical protein
MPNAEERKLVDELDREVSQSGGLLVLVACLATAAGLALATALTMVAIPA